MQLVPTHMYGSHLFNISGVLQSLCPLDNDIMPCPVYIWCYRMEHGTCTVKYSDEALFYKNMYVFQKHYDKYMDHLIFRDIVWTIKRACIYHALHSDIWLQLNIFDKR